MTKQIEIEGQQIKLYSLDEGRTWSSSPQAIVAYGQRKRLLRMELKKSFERAVGMQDPDPNSISELEIPRSFIGQ